MAAILALVVAGAVDLVPVKRMTLAAAVAIVVAEMHSLVLNIASHIDLDPVNLVLDLSLHSLDKDHPYSHHT